MSEDGTRFHVYSSYDRIYLWPHSGSPLPDEVDLSQATAVLPEALLPRSLPSPPPSASPTSADCANRPRS